MTDIQVIQDMGTKLMDQCKLVTFPLAVNLIKPGQEPPAGAVRPREAFGAAVPACLVYTWCRRSGFSFFMDGTDIACKPINLYFGLEELKDPEDLFRAWETHAAYKESAEAEKRSREEDEILEPGEITGIAVSPLHLADRAPDVVMVFCSPLVLSHLILAATYKGTSLTSRFNGMESTCKEGIIRTYKTGECQVVNPGMGDRVMAGVQDHEVVFAMPGGQVEGVLDNLFQAGNKIQPPPFGIPHLTPTLGAGTLFGQPVRPGVWPDLSAKMKEKG